MLELSEYRDAIKLDEPWPIPESDTRSNLDLFTIIFGGLSDEDRQAGDIALFDRMMEQLVHREPGPLDPDVERAYDVLLARRSAALGRTEASHLMRIKHMMPESEYPLGNLAGIWRGDISELVADAVVIGAQPDLLGWRGEGPSADQAVQSQAGPWLRNDCQIIHDLQGADEEVGGAKITRGYRLPARYVLHTVPPTIAPGAEVTDADREALASCYTSCLDLAAETGNVRSISFGALAIGRGNFPPAEAAHIALQAVLDWFNTHRSSKVQIVIFNIFDDEAAETYVDTINRWIED